MFSAIQVGSTGRLAGSLTVFEAERDCERCGLMKDDIDKAMDFFSEGSLADVTNYVLPTMLEKGLLWGAITVGGLGCGMLQSRSMYLEATLLFLATLAFACVLGRRCLLVVAVFFGRKLTSRKGSDQ